jgi:hypothetical protein
MARIGFCGASYTSKSVNADCQLTQNLYPEHDESGMGKSEWQMLPTPGLTIFSVLSGITRVGGSLNANKRCFEVSGDTLYEVFSDGTNAVIGVVGDDGNPVSMTNSATQLLIASAGNLYVYDLTSGVFQAVTVGIISAVSMVAYSDGFFIALLANSQKFQISSPLDATTWDPTDVTQVTVFPDQVLSMIVDHREIGLFGVTKSVWYSNTGGVFPFTPNLSSYMESGIGAQWTLNKADNTVCWLESDDRGNAIARRLNGYSPVRISNHAVEQAWQSYSTIADANSYTDQVDGHIWWHVNFPTANVTWVYDFATQLWHQRSYLNDGVNEAHLSHNHTFVFGLHLVGDRRNGNIYVQSVKLVDDDGQLIQRRRRCPHISIEQKRIRHNSLQIDVEAGLNPIAPPLGGVVFSNIAGPSGNPLAFLSEVYVCVVAIYSDGSKQVSPVSALLDSTDSRYFRIVVTPHTGIISWRIYFFPTTDTPAYYQSYTAPQMAGFGNVVLPNSATVQGVSIDTLTLARAPELELNYSDDGGHVYRTWGNLSVGAAGEYKYRCIARRLGISRDRVYEVVCTDTIPWRFIDAYLDADPGYGVTERQSNQLRKGA